ncbi:MAG: hypothetical protein MUE85_00685 [Microscillaceae bacterium]|jgi:hypothetical protein|nr:hypothetical protein [Microscillaceae bacterium]
MRKIQLSILTLIALVWANTVVTAQTDVLNSLIKTVSPVEVSDLIKKQGIRYEKTILSDPMKTAAYQSDFKKALNLGVYSTDLGYSSIYEQNMEALSYLSSVKKMADGLNVGSYIDFNKILMLAQNKNDLNKLLDETSTTFENMSEHLEKQNQSKLAALILTGGWLETLFITCEVAKRQPNQELHNRIVEQKLILDQILVALQPYQNDNTVKLLTSDLSNLSKLLGKYTFEVVKKNSQSEKKYIEVNGEKIAVDEGEDQTNDVKLTPDDINRISGMVTEIRGQIIK